MSKSIKTILISLLLAAICIAGLAVGLTNATANSDTLKPGGYFYLNTAFVSEDWKMDGAKIYFHYETSEEGVWQWEEMMPYKELLRVKIPDDMKRDGSFVLRRMSPEWSVEAENWLESQWHQIPGDNETISLTSVPDNCNTFLITGWDTGEWAATGTWNQSNYGGETLYFLNMNSEEPFTDGIWAAFSGEEEDVKIPLKAETDWKGLYSLTIPKGEYDTITFYDAAGNSLAETKIWNGSYHPLTSNTFYYQRTLVSDGSVVSGWDVFPEEEVESTESTEETESTEITESTENIETEEEEISTEEIAVYAGEPRTVYFDASVSKLPYYREDVGIMSDFGLPSNGILSYHAWNSVSQTAEDGIMQLAPYTDGNGRTWNDVYKAEIAPGYDRIIFFSGTYLGAETAGTVDLTIPDDDNLCFYPDTGDDIVYGSAKYRRGGYWGKPYETRDTETGKNLDIVDIDTGTFRRVSRTYYATATLYDYYTDYELNGWNRDNYNTNGVNISSHRIYQPFRQFNQALSDFYSANSADSPLYYGNFQNYGGDNAAHFTEISGSLNLYGFDSNGYSDAYKKFFYENNSMWDRNGGEVTNGGINATIGLVNSTLQDGNLMINTANGSVQAPFFDEGFLRGNNTKNAVLGEVYSNVKFPFMLKTMSGVEKIDGSRATGTVDYWYFNSMDDDSSTTNKHLTLKRDSSSGAYYLESTNDIVKGKTTYGETGSGNYFPFNGSGQSGNAGRLNYGYGQKMDIVFRLTESGTVLTTNNEEIPVKFTFEGDDDVWVFIDGQLVLDVGGDHGIVNGVIDFYNKKSIVSNVKGANGGTFPNYTTDLSGLLTSDFYLTEHTLTMFYMERGLWESNLYVTFNFPDESKFSVEKEVDVDTEQVNDLFADLFLDTSFPFNIKNQATHYPAQGAGETVGFVIQQADIPGYGSVTSGKLENAAQATYSLTGKRKIENLKVDGNGIFSLKDGDKATFVNQFRYGSYIYLKEAIDTDAFYVNWELYESDELVTDTRVPENDAADRECAVGGKVLTEADVSLTTISDGRQELYLYKADDPDYANSGYTNTGPAKITEDGSTKPTDQTMVFRSFEDPYNTIAMDLKVKEINTVRTGSLTIAKDQTDDTEDLEEQEFEFTVIFSNVAGLQLEGETPIEVKFKLKKGESKTISGIPAKTEYEISEKTEEGYSLKRIDIASGNDRLVLVNKDDEVIGPAESSIDVSGAKVVNVTGIVAADDEVDAKTTEITFVNEKTTGSIDITKKNNSELLAGVEFTLYEEDKTTVATDINGYELKGITSSNGTLSFHKIPVGTRGEPKIYYLQETKTTSGHVLLIEPIMVTLPYEYHAGDIVNGETVTEDGITYHLAYTIINDQGFLMPSTGQQQKGPVAYVTIGIILTGTALGVLLIRRRQKKVITNWKKYNKKGR